MYKVSGKMEVDVKPTGFRIYKKLNTLFEKEKPDIIVCTHPVCAKSVASYIKKTGDNIPLVTCITDISMHPEWITPQTTAYLAPTREVKESLVDRGADRDNVFVTGIPVRQQFLIKREPNTAKTPRKILIMAGILVKKIPWSSLTINATRSIFAFAVIFLYTRVTKHKCIMSGPVVFGAVCNCAMSTTFVLATKLTSAANAIVLQFTEPIFVILIVWAFYKKKPDRSAVIACAVTFGGILCFFFDKITPGNMISD